MTTKKKSNSLINEDQWDEVVYENDDKCFNPIGISIFSVALFLIGLVFTIVALFINSGDSNWFWGWLRNGTIGLYSVGVFFLILIPIIKRDIDNNSEFINSWKEQPQLIFWRKKDFPSDIWSRYLEDEYGIRGRSVNKYDTNQIIIYIIFWICLCGIICGLMLLFGGAILYRVLIAVFGITFIILLMIAIQELIVWINRSKAKTGPHDFIANDNAFLWQGRLFNCGTGNYSIVFKIEDKRINLYHGLLHPCIEICTSTQSRHGNKYQYHRIPIPPNKMEEAEKFAKLLSAHQNDCWKYITGYAKDLEKEVII